MKAVQLEVIQRAVYNYRKLNDPTGIMNVLTELGNDAYLQKTGQVNILIPSASIYGSGSILLIKDEVGHIDGSNILINAATGYTIDGDASYALTGSNPAISLYSNGANWFVF